MATDGDPVWAYRQCRGPSMSRILIVATAGAGGDLQPLLATALALRDRGHDTVFVGDRSVQRSRIRPCVSVQSVPREAV